MYCRHCANEVSEKAVGCPKCGMNPRTGTEFCHDCGSETKSSQVMCTNCGVALNKSGSLAKSSSSAASAGGDYDRLYRSSDQKMLLGLCGGIAHKAGMDASLVRGLGFLAAIISWGFLLIIYLGLGLILPKMPTKDVVLD